jgi:hypothetical protein
MAKAKFIVALDCMVLEPGQTVSPNYKVKILVVATDKDDAAKRVGEAIAQTANRRHVQEFIDEQLDSLTGIKK